MQNAKDTFYLTLRDRLAALNPGRTVQVRGALRPAIVVAENELEQDDAALLEAFVLTWKITTIDSTEPRGCALPSARSAMRRAAHRRVPAWIAAACWMQWTRNCGRSCSPVTS